MRDKNKNLVVRLTESQLKNLVSKYQLKLNGLNGQEAIAFSLSEYVRSELGLGK